MDGGRRGGAVPKGVQAETALFSELERTSSGVHVAGRSPPEEAKLRVAKRRLKQAQQYGYQ